MSNTWIISENVLRYTINGDTYIAPSAEDIFSSIALSNASTAHWSAEIAEAFPSLRFSRISSKLHAHFWFAEDHINIEFITRRRGINISILPSAGFPDHYVHNNTWFYLSNITQELKTCITKWTTPGTTVITVGQYVNLLKEFHANQLIEYIDDAAEFLQNKKMSATEIPTGIKATLYPYQEDGFRWMDFMLQERCGCILGDEMGLGKTLQIITLITKHISPNNHFLIVAPVTLLENWRREFLKFAPSVKVLVHHGSSRTGFYKNFLPYDVVVISYGTAVSDQAILNMIKWKLVVLDEAQNIKNPGASRSKAVKKLNREIGIAVTGTPFENHMTDLWSLMDFVAPGVLGTLSEFSSQYSDDSESAKKIEQILSPIMVRRRVADVAKDLPERVDIPEILLMDAQEILMYEDERLRIVEELGEKAATLATLQKLRMYCTHPSLIQEEKNFIDPDKYSVKYRRMCEILSEIIAKREKAILFTSYTGMFNILLSDIPSRFHIPVYSINGATPVEDRQPTVDTFSAVKGSALLVLNPRAAGTGLNITAANYVIHYNLEWNPALEDQASARAYRRGQTKTVFVYRLFYANTVEQIVNDRIELKRDLSDTAVIGVSGTQENRDDIMNALLLSPKEATQ